MQAKSVSDVRSNIFILCGEKDIFKSHVNFKNMILINILPLQRKYTVYFTTYIILFGQYKATMKKQLT